MKKALIPLGLAVPLALASAGAAAADRTTVLQAGLTTLNDSGATGSATVEVTGDRVDIELETHGLAAGLPHAQHLHIGGESRCPTRDADDNEDGRISTSEGIPSYGPIAVSLTTRGDTGQDSALAAERMPTADPENTVRYSRTIEVSDDVAARLRAGEAVVVQHGVDRNGNGKYDGEARSDVDTSAPAEATDPAVCGELRPVPVDGVDAGGGGAADDNRLLLLALGGTALLATAAGGTFTIRRARRGR